MVKLDALGNATEIGQRYCVVSTSNGFTYSTVGILEKYNKTSVTLRVESKKQSLWGEKYETTSHGKTIAVQTNKLVPVYNRPAENQLLQGANLYYPSATEWMWNYCTYLGPYTYDGDDYDMGILLRKDGNHSAAIVYGNEPGNYISGDINTFTGPLYTEMIKRAKAIGLIPISFQRLCPCGGNERVALDCTMKPCKHPNYAK